MSIIVLLCLCIFADALLARGPEGLWLAPSRPSQPERTPWSIVAARIDGAEQNDLDQSRIQKKAGWRTFRRSVSRLWAITVRSFSSGLSSNRQKDALKASGRRLT